MITVQTLTQTCPASPSQWEGRTTEGRWVYVRYRWGWLQVGFGATFDEAVRDQTIERQLGDGYDGELSLDELKAATADTVTWP